MPTFSKSTFETEVKGSNNLAAQTSNSACVSQSNDSVSISVNILLISSWYIESYSGWYFLKCSMSLNLIAVKKNER